MTVSENDLTIRILREIQTDVRELKVSVASLEEKHEVTNERLSMVERGVTFSAAQINVMRRHLGIEEKQTGEEIRDLQARVARLEDLVIKP